MGQRTNTAVWLPNQQRWQIKVQKDGVRKTFTSSKPGRTGQREANRKADAWLDEGISCTTKRCTEVWTEFLISAKATAGTSYADQIKKFGRNYILPVIGARRIGDLSAGMLQDVLNRAYREGCLNPESTRRSKGNLSRKTLQGIRGVEMSFVKWARLHQYTALRPEDEVIVPKGARNKGKRSCSRTACGCFYPRTPAWCVEKLYMMIISMHTASRSSPVCAPESCWGCVSGTWKATGCISGAPSTARTRKRGARTTTPSAR